nr:MAG TPA: hypothetical protein [Caudoviricetes sp.]
MGGEISVLLFTLLIGMTLIMFKHILFNVG